MAFYRLPGPLCVTGALPVDSGTLVRASTPSPGPLLTTDENGFIQNFTGRDEDGNPLPLATLLHWYDQFVQLHKEAASQFGVQSGSARRMQATVERLAKLIAEVQSPSGRANEKLGRLIEGQATEEELRKGVADVLAAEKEMASRGLSDQTGLAGMALIARASEVVAERKRAEFENRVEDARRPDSKVTDEQLRDVVVTSLSIERQRQLLGAGDDSSTLATNALVAEVLKIDNGRRKKRVKDQIEEAKGADGKITPEKLQKLQKSVQEMLGSERQVQLLGLEDEGASGESAMELLSEAVEISYESHKADLKVLIEETKRPGNKVTRKEISRRVANILGDERSRQLMGTSGDKADQELSDLLEEALKIAGEREKPASNSPRKSTVSITVGPIQLLRTPFRR